MREPDIEVMFSFTSSNRKVPYQDGYRCDHLVHSDYLTCGQHKYYNPDGIPPMGTGYGTITFIQPEAYPGSLFTGKVIPLQEGARVIGSATIITVFNPILQSRPST